MAYFPAYEALVDDLRDYRFYAEDLVHPSSVGVEYVYSLFASTYFTEKTREEAVAREKEFRRAESSSAKSSVMNCGSDIEFGL